MINDKTRKKIEVMREAGKILGEVLFEVMNAIKPGVTEIELDKLAERLILEKGAEPGFKKVDGYEHSICVSTNDVVVHGIPKDRELKNGDIIGVDCGVYLNGYHTDMAETKIVGETSNPEVVRFVEAGKKAMFAGIRQAKVGRRVGHISQAMQEVMEGSGYSVVKSLVGHGVGKELHEEPEIPGYGEIGTGPALKSDMTLAIEVIYTKGKYDLVLEKDNWTYSTADKSWGGLFEMTVIVGKQKAEVLTFWK